MLSLLQSRLIECKRVRDQDHPQMLQPSQRRYCLFHLASQNKISVALTISMSSSSGGGIHRPATTLALYKQIKSYLLFFDP
jgi:hypothetical protein